MNTGGLIFAYNSRDVDYAVTAIIAGGLAKKHLNIPFSLITDESTVEWMKESKVWAKANEVFENFILTDRPVNYNSRLLNDGTHSSVVPFINSGRSMAFDLSPYDKTLLIDSDYLVFSNKLSKYLELDHSVMIGSAMNDIQGERIGFLDKTVSDVGVHLLWATTVIFTKDAEAKLFFNLVKHVEKNYQLFSDLYRYSSKQYRNDIAFSVAKHIIDGFETVLDDALPPILTVHDKDILVDVNQDKLTFLITDINAPDKFIACTVVGQDTHVMNKQSIIRHKNNLLELI
jgi:hypothetical protein